MKRLVIILDPITQQYKGHRALLYELSHDIALYNGGNYGDPEKKDADKFIEELFKGQGLQLHHVNDWTFRFGHKKTKGYVHYGEIIKTVVL